MPTLLEETQELGLLEKQLDSPSALRLAELSLLQFDINHSIKAIEIWSAEFCDRGELAERDRTVSISLYRDAIVQFTGCFAGRSSLSASDVYGHIEGGPETYQFLLDMRDAYAAHNFGPLRQAVSIAMFKPDFAELIRVGCPRWIYHGGLTRSIGDELRRFMQVAQTHVDARMESARDQVHSEVSSMSVDEWRALNEPQIHHAEIQDIRSSRSRFRAKAAKKI